MFLPPDWLAFRKNAREPESEQYLVLLLIHAENPCIKNHVYNVLILIFVHRDIQMYEA